MIVALEIWLQHEDGRQQVIRVGDEVVVRELPGVEVAARPPERPISADGVAVLDDLLHELRHDEEAFHAMGDQRRAAYAGGLAERLTTILRGEDERDDG
jgi:hypothetical protein